MSPTQQTHDILRPVNDEREHIANVAPQNTDVERGRIREGRKLSLEEDSLPGFPRHADLRFNNYRTGRVADPFQAVGASNARQAKTAPDVFAQDRAVCRAVG